MRVITNDKGYRVSERVLTANVLCAILSDHTPRHSSLYANAHKNTLFGHNHIHDTYQSNMTIRVEREALLTVINTSQSSAIHSTSSVPTSTSLSSKPCNPCIREEDEFVIVDAVPTKEFYSDFIPDSTGEDDLASLCTISTSSLSSCDDTSTERRVTFATDLVSDVWTRERTLPEEVSNLFYSALETQTVRIST